MSSLDLETIQKLLKDDTAQTVVTKKKASTGETIRPVQIGPLKYKDESMRCAARGCGSPTLIEINGVPYCYTHAIYALNHIVIQIHSDYNLQDCTCNAGRHSMGNVHTDDCPIYDQEMKARNGDTSSS